MKPIYVIGCGAVGIPLAAGLIRSGKTAVAVRARRTDAIEESVEYRLEVGGSRIDTVIPTVGVSSLGESDSIAVVATKANWNRDLARRLTEIGFHGPIVVMQNGMGVETPFVDAGFTEVYRSVLYIVSEGDSQSGYRFNAVKPSPLGVVVGSTVKFKEIYEALENELFPLCHESDISREIWTKTIVNSVFNSICPLVDADNGLFSREETARQLAREVIAEGVAVAERKGVNLSGDILFERVLQISRKSTQAISTLQDIRAGRETEIEFINLELARVGRFLNPPVLLPKTESLGKLVELKSILSRKEV